MSKKCIIFIIFLSFSMGIFGASFKRNSIFHMDASAEFGIINGEIKEYVFSDFCKNTDGLVSRLDWQVLTLPYGELNISFDLFRYLYVGFSGRIGIPLRNGVMEDFDWLNSMPSSPLLWRLGDPTELTNYSKHNNQVDKYYNFNFRIGGNIPVTRKFVITPYLGYQYDLISMAAFSGFTRYKWDDFEEKPMPEGKCISYAQEANEFIIGAKFAAYHAFNIPLNFSLFMQCVPGLGKFSALDMHYARNTAFLDVYSPIFLFDAKLSCFYEINYYNKVGISSFVNVMPLMKGVTGVGYITDGKPSKVFQGDPNSKGGASRLLFGVSLSYQFSF